MRDRGFTRPGVIIALIVAMLPSLASGPVAAQGDSSGLVDGTSYESPQFGYTLSWDDSWAARQRDITSNQGGFDTITIRHDTGTLRVSGRADDEPAIDFLNDTVDLIARNADASAIVSENLEGEIPSIEFTADRDHLIVEAYSLPDSGAVVVLTLRAQESEFATSLAAARANIALNDEPILRDEDAPSAEVPAPATPEADDLPPPDAATPEASSEGIDGETYTSPTYGYSLIWDANIWEAESLVGEDGYNELRLASPSVTLSIWSGPYYEGDPASCLEGEAEYFEGSDPSVSDWQPAEDADGNPIAGETSNASYGVFTLSYTDPETEDAEPVELVDYMECRSLVEGESVLVIFATTTPERYNDAIEDVLRITNAIELAGEDGEPDAPTPDAGTPVAIPGASPEGLSGLAGSIFTSPSFGFSLDIPPVWSVDDEIIAEEYELLVLNNGTSLVTLQATDQYSGDLEGCVAFAYAQVADVPAFADLEPDVTSTGDPFEGSNAEGAYANFTYTGPDDEKYAHFISCRAIVEGESVLILTQDVPYDAYATQRQARRQIENAIVLP
jgi:hypothetical protein